VIENKENINTNVPIIYQYKSLTPSLPKMELLNEKYRKIRMTNLSKMKEKLNQHGSYVGIYRQYLEEGLETPLEKQFLKGI